MNWITPKTNWVSTDWLNIEDYNRIRNNILFLTNLCQQLYTPEFTTTIGNDKTYADRLYADELNAIEIRLKELNDFSVRVDTYGEAKTYFDNGRGIDATELNRIESVSLDLYRRFKDASGGRKKLRFRLIANSFDNF